MACRLVVACEAAGGDRHATPAGGCGPAPTDGIQPPGMHPRRGPARVRGRPRRPAPSPRVPRSRASPSVVAWARPAAHRRAVSGPRGPPVRSRGSVPGGRAPLRGAVSHEAKGRGRARGGGAGRVRAPAGRLRLPGQIGDELVPGVEQFLLVDDVVAVEDGAALVPG